MTKEEKRLLEEHIKTMRELAAAMDRMPRWIYTYPAYQPYYPPSIPYWPHGPWYTGAGGGGFVPTTTTTIRPVTSGTLYVSAGDNLGYHTAS